MKNICRLIVWAFAALYALALAVYALGYLGWLAADSDALSGIYLVILGLPWTRFVDAFPERTWPILTVLTPAINLAILYAICRVLNRNGR